MRRRLIALGFLTVILAGALFIRRSSSAGVSCNSSPIGLSPVIGSMVNGGSVGPPAYPAYQNFDAPSDVKYCLQHGIIDNPGSTIFAAVWLPNTVSGPVGPPIPIVVSGALVLTSGFPGAASNVHILYKDSYLKTAAGVEIPGSRGVVTFGSSDDDLGSLDPNNSKGKTQGASIDSTRLSFGANIACIQYNFSLISGGSTITSSTGDGDWCTNVNYPTDNYDNYPIVSPLSVTALPGQTILFQTQVQNVSTGQSPNLQFDASNPDATPGYFVPVSSPPASITASNGFQWVNQPGPPGGTTTAALTFSFTVGVTATPGSHCGVVQIQPAAGQSTPSVTVTTATRSVSFCITVQNSRAPYLTTSGGDVHAGGGVTVGISCASGAPGAGNVIGQTQGGPLTQVQYVVSAKSSISNVSSGVSLGNVPPVGQYGKVCRPDLDRAVALFPAAKKFAFSVFANNLSLVLPGVIVTAGTGVGCTHIPGGLVASNYTLYITGDVCLDGNIQYNSVAVPVPVLPGFGLIATGDINIAPGVTRLDGYYFAGSRSGPWGLGKIDTCNNGSALSIVANASQCSNHLDVFGLMMGNDFRFARTGPTATNGPVETEKATFLGDLFLAPPPAFLDVTSPRATRTRYQGEYAPLY